jgi:hypothetical protein
MILSVDCTKTLASIKNTIALSTGNLVSTTTIYRAIKALNFSLKRLIHSQLSRNTPTAI